MREGEGQMNDELTIERRIFRTSENSSFPSKTVTMSVFMMTPIRAVTFLENKETLEMAARRRQVCAKKQCENAIADTEQTQYRSGSPFRNR